MRILQAVVVAVACATANASESHIRVHPRPADDGAPYDRSDPRPSLPAPAGFGGDTTSTTPSAAPSPTACSAAPIALSGQTGTAGPFAMGSAAAHWAPVSGICSASDAAISELDGSTHVLAFS